MSKLVCGVGVYEKGKYVAYVGGISTKEYRIWISMLQRCYLTSVQTKYPTYIGCSVSENFKNFQWFAEWCNNQIGFGIKGYQLDKDIIIKGNKVYSEDTCVFLPKPVNMFLTDCKRLRGSLPIGVTLHKLFRVNGKIDTYIRACISSDNKNISLGSYDTPEAAFAAYKEAKEAMAKQLAIKWAGMVDDRVITALNNFEVHYND
jgi:hypothetical protein